MEYRHVGQVARAARDLVFVDDALIAAGPRRLVRAARAAGGDERDRDKSRRKKGMPVDPTIMVSPPGRIDSPGIDSLPASKSSKTFVRIIATCVRSGYHTPAMPQGSSLLVRAQMAVGRPWRRSSRSGLIAIAPAAQSSTDKWWPGYGNGPDNSRYFASSQINKSNVSQLEVAWTYPYGDTGSIPIVVRGVVYGRGRNGSLVAVDAKTGKELWIRENMNGMTSRGINYWESADGRDQRLDLLDEQPAPGGGCEDRQVDHVVRHERRRRFTRWHRRPRSGDHRQHPVEHARRGLRESDPPRQRTGEGYMSPPGDIRAYDVLTGKLVWTFHTVPRPGEFGYETWPKDAWKYIGGVNAWGEMTVDIRAASSTSRSGRPPTTSTAPIGSARICSGHRSWRSTRAPASGCGTSRSCITTSGTWIPAPRRN